MSVTHYWRRPTELPAAAFAKAASDCRQVLQAADVDVAGFDGQGEPLLTAERIVFNGRSPRACEPFEIAAVEFDRHGRPEVRSYCKTQLLPYDVTVKAVLVVLAHHLAGSLAVTSDQPAEEWAGAMRLVEGELGYGQAFELRRD